MPPGPGVCSVCRTAASPGFRMCFRCNAAASQFGARLADVVVPIALAVKGEQLAHELWHYKYDADSRVRDTLRLRLAAVLWRFLRQHEHHIAAAVGVSGFGVVTTVPGTRERTGPHPLQQITGTIVGHTRDRYETLLALGPGAAAPSHTLDAGRYRAVRALRGGPGVLLVDDTWTTGSNAQAAALALRSAGAGTVAVVVIGRHFDRSFRGCEAYYRKARARPFTWDTCCLEVTAERGI